MFVDPLGRHVVRCAHQRVGSRCLSTEKTAQTQVTQFDHPVAGDEDVGWFNVFKTR